MLKSDIQILDAIINSSQCSTVGDLKRLLEKLPDDMEIATEEHRDLGAFYLHLKLVNEVDYPYCLSDFASEEGEGELDVEEDIEDLKLVLGICPA